MNRYEAEFKYRYLSSLIKAAADQYTKTGKVSIYDLQRQSEALEKRDCQMEAELEACSNFVRENTSV